MAKRQAKVEATKPSEWEPADFSQDSRTMQLINKTFGDGVCINGEEIKNRKRQVVSISPNIDAGLGGGVIEGSMLTLAGIPGCGKTGTAIWFARQFQRLGRRVIYIAAEGRIYERLLEVHGFEPNKIEKVESRKGKIMTAEDYLLAADIAIRNEEKALIIIDSFSILSTNAEMAMADYDKSPPVGGSARLVSLWCKRMAPIIPINDNVVLGIAHVYANIGGRKKWATSMSGKVEYGRSAGMTCEWSELLKEGDSAKVWGRKLHWNVDRSPLGAEGVKFESILRYGYGIDKEWELVEQGVLLGLIDKGGKWFKFDFLDDDSFKPFDGIEAAADYLRENPDVYQDLNRKVRALSFDGEAIDEDC